MKAEIDYDHEGKTIIATTHVALPEKVEDKLRAIGFKQHKEDKRKWEVAAHPAYEAYAKEFVRTLNDDLDHEDIRLTASYLPTKENLEKKKFSHVTIYITLKEKEVAEEYIIFDTYKKVCENLAEQYGKEKYGQAFQRVLIQPRNHIKKSRQLFSEERIITGHEIQQNKPPQLILTNANGEFTPETAKGHYKNYEIDFPENAKAIVSIQVVHTSEGYRVGYDTFSYVEGSGVTVPITQLSRVYENEKEAYKTALTEITEFSVWSALAIKVMEGFAQEHQVDWTFDTQETNVEVQQTTDYIDRIVAHMHLLFAEGKRATKKQIEALADTYNISLGKVWEAVELSWMMWYKQLYHDKSAPFTIRLKRMTHFWENVQPTYGYNDSSKMLYQQYSTSCPIAAIVAEYTEMDTTKKVFEPSAGNGLFVLGASPLQTHVNEIDESRLASLQYQGFATITDYNASKPFPKTLEKQYDIVVSNPPFGKWEEDRFEKSRIGQQYFSSHPGMLSRLRLEQLMVGLSLRMMKDNGKAALIINEHIQFNQEGWMKRYRYFFNWLYHHYHVEDIINLNSYKLYNKQGAVQELMLILINGRKEKPHGAAPLKKQAPHLEELVNSFDELWQRVNPISSVEKITQQLKIAL